MTSKATLHVKDSILKLYLTVFSVPIGMEWLKSETTIHALVGEKGVGG